MRNSRTQVLYFNVPMLFVRLKGSSHHERYDPGPQAKGSHVVLTMNSWNDYGYKTTHAARYYDELGNATYLGIVKILQKNKSSTLIPNRFRALGDSFISLGQNIEYYQLWVKALGKDNALDALRCLRDAAVAPELLDLFMDHAGVGQSLLRFSEALTAQRRVPKIIFFLSNEPSDVNTDFTFQCQLKGFDDYHILRLSFPHQDSLPHRITALVGKNGTGKSGTIAMLGKVMSGLGLQDGEAEISPSRPDIIRTICLSFSPWQPFLPPIERTTSYIYSGIVWEENVSFSRTKDNISAAFERILSQQRISTWSEYLGISDLMNGVLASVKTVSELTDILSMMSSGQLMVVGALTEVIAWLDSRSLLLFDEPEAYLHPTLLSTLLRQLHDLLNLYDSFAVIATHSPIVIQEVPSKYIRIFEREGTIPRVRSPKIESFGNNLSDLTSEIFQMNNDDVNFSSIFKGLMSDGKDIDSIESLFDNRLSLNARLTLHALNNENVEDNG